MKKHERTKKAGGGSFPLPIPFLTPTRPTQLIGTSQSGVEFYTPLRAVCITSGDRTSGLSELQQEVCGEGRVDIGLDGVLVRPQILDVILACQNLN
jgi:hypothetical protein